LPPASKTRARRMRCDKPSLSGPHSDSQDRYGPVPKVRAKSAGSSPLVPAFQDGRRDVPEAHQFDTALLKLAAIRRILRLVSILGPLVRRLHDGVCGRVDFGFEDGRTQTLKNIARPI
jgi:hypothetical protein